MCPLLVLNKLLHGSHNTAVVELDAKHAATSGVLGHEDLHLKSCTRWPERADCDEDCLPQALKNPIVLEQPPRESHNPFRGIHHIAVLIAAGVFWIVGAFWYSEKFFRPSWMRLIGLSDSAGRQRFDTNSYAFTLAFVGGLVFARMDAHLLAIGVAVFALGAVLHLCIQIPGLIKYRFHWTPSINLKDERVRQVLYLVGPRLVTMFCRTAQSQSNPRVLSVPRSTGSRRTSSL